MAVEVGNRLIPATLCTLAACDQDGLERGKEAAGRRGGTRRLRMYRLRGVTAPFRKSVLSFVFFWSEKTLVFFGVLGIGRSPPLLLTKQTARPERKLCLSPSERPEFLQLNSKKC